MRRLQAVRLHAFGALAGVFPAAAPTLLLRRWRFVFLVMMYIEGVGVQRVERAFSVVAPVHFPAAPRTQRELLPFALGPLLLVARQAGAFIDEQDQL